MRNIEACHFAKTHEWLDQDGTVGISDHAQREITDVVFVDLPKPGSEFKSGDPIAVIESVKAAFDIYTPVSGKVVEVNQELSKTPALINQSPYDKGWIFKLETNNDEERQNLMNFEGYNRFLESDEN